MQDYKDYLLREAHTEDFDGFLICFNHEGLMAYLDQIEQEPYIQDNKGTLLIDQLLVTGNGKNRFLSVPFDHGTMILEEADMIEPDLSYRKKSSEYLNEHSHLLTNTILTDQELEYIEKKHHF